MNKNILTPDIIVETLKRSSLDTVLIEGQDDKQIFEYIEKDIKDQIIDFFPWNGRNNLIEVYKRRKEIDTKCLYFCDSDLWLFKDCEFERDETLISTTGYSIENDLFEDSKEFILSLFDDDEFGQFETLINNLSRWFAYQVHLYLNGMPCSYADKSILSDNFMQNLDIITQDYKDFDYRKIDSSIIEKFDNYPHVYLRGKFLFQIFEYIFQQRSNNVRFTKKQLFDLIYRQIDKTNENKILFKNIELIKDFFK
ncbi:DUF4435 domain-containing protein [Paenimyroides baculatum]|uniref:DUF4435 domain-containing protein n=1 Tax=Paenimyroides baculatum TaxID=2608000 RepID=A0A5M6C986_9FLAO|nr:DUF4435 domain-containing protein [Paenimyroides baculatum]KAA5531654.1 DUF4435 domain-containing protein [Paenimyroides baculatum]